MKYTYAVFVYSAVKYIMFHKQPVDYFLKFFNTGPTLICLLEICSVGLPSPLSEFIEFEPRLKSAKNRFQLSTGLNLETLNTILSEINHI